MKIFLHENDIVSAHATARVSGPGSALVVVTLNIKEGWFVRAIAEDDYISPFQLDIRGDAVSKVVHTAYPPSFHIDLLGDPELIYWQGSVEFVIDVRLHSAPPLHGLRAVLSFQPCTVGRCLPMQHAVTDVLWESAVA